MNTSQVRAVASSWRKDTGAETGRESSTVEHGVGRQWQAGGPAREQVQILSGFKPSPHKWSSIKKLPPSNVQTAPVILPTRVTWASGYSQHSLTGTQAGGTDWPERFCLNLCRVKTKQVFPCVSFLEEYPSLKHRLHIKTNYEWKQIVQQIVFLI